MITRLWLPDDAPPRLALLADTHIGQGPDSAPEEQLASANLARVVDEVIRAAPSTAIVLGDLAWVEGLESDYSRLARMIAPLVAAVPVVMTLGNHDNRGAFLRTFRLPRAEEEPPPAKLIAVIEHPVAKFILLDSLFRTDVVPGLLGKEQLAWLRRELAGDKEKPVILGAHHAVDAEDSSLLDSHRLLTLARQFPCVKAILSAHRHNFGCATVEGISRICLPAVGPPFHPAEPTGWVEAEVLSSGIELQFHAEGRPRRPVRFPWRRDI